MCRTIGGPSTCASGRMRGRRPSRARNISMVWQRSMAAVRRRVPMPKELRVGIVGCGFMGRTHSNAYKRLKDFFPVEHRPVLKAVCARNADKAKQFAENWGYERIESDW